MHILAQQRTTYNDPIFNLIHISFFCNNGSGQWRRHHRRERNECAGRQHEGNRNIVYVFAGSDDNTTFVFKTYMCIYERIQNTIQACEGARSQPEHDVAQQEEGHRLAADISVSWTH